MNKVLRLLNILRKRKLGIVVGLLFGGLAFFALPMMFSLVYAGAMKWEAQHLDGLMQFGVHAMTFTFMIVLAIMVLTGLRAFIANVFRCRWYKTR